MIIHCGKEHVETPCTGCMCHEMDMIFGSNPDFCAECGCPKTLKGFRSYQEKKLKEPRTAAGSLD